jgi:hypothetical protein
MEVFSVLAHRWVSALPAGSPESAGEPGSALASFGQTRVSAASCGSVCCPSARLGEGEVDVSCWPVDAVDAERCHQLLDPSGRDADQIAAGHDRDERPLAASVVLEQSQPGT